MEEVDLIERSEIINELIAEINKESDKRIDRCKKHTLAEIFLLVLCAQICSWETFREYETYGKVKLEFLRNFLPYKDGSPSRSTIWRVLAIFDPKHLESLFIRWMQELIKTREQTPDQQCIESAEDEVSVVAIDGKRHRGSLGQELHLVSAYTTGNGLVLGQEAVKDKSNEIIAIPVLLDMLEIQGQLVSMDAMGCQTAIAKKTRSKGADYMLALKKNQGGLYEQVEDYFRDDQCRASCAVVTRTSKGHGRIEVRTCYVTQKIDWINGKSDWQDLAAIVMIESKRILKGKASIERRFFITSSRATAATLLSASRSHWGIENSLHWVLDVVFREDERIIWNRNLAHNEAVIRRIALNLLRNYRTIRPTKSVRSEKIAIKTLRKVLITSDTEMTQLLTGALHL